MLYTVRTLDDSALTQAANKLFALAANDFKPDLLVGIRTGGYGVAEKMSTQANLLPITQKRSSTIQKQQSSLFIQIIRRLPYAITNLLRVAEHMFLQSKRCSSEIKKFDESEILAIQNSGASSILIVDDSVDSGATLATVLHKIRIIAPSATIKTAAITVTTTNPIIKPDYFLYQHTLCRFPWSYDFRG